MEGTVAVPVAVDFMLSFLGKAAAGGRVRGNRKASEDGPLRDGARRKKETSFVKL